MTDVAPPPSSTRIVLLGMMGSGKSSVGDALTRRTGWPFLDNDVLVKRATGRTARQLLAEVGEGAMRAAESAALRAGLAIPTPVIVAVAAGTVLDPADRALIASHGFVVWLHAPAAVLAARAIGASHRPWLDDDPVNWFRRTIAERRHLYEAVADLQVDTDRTSPDDAAEAIVGALATRA